MEELLKQLIKEVTATKKELQEIKKILEPKEVMFEFSRPGELTVK